MLTADGSHAGLPSAAVVSAFSQHSTAQPRPDALATKEKVNAIREVYNSRVR